MQYVPVFCWNSFVQSVVCVCYDAFILQSTFVYDAFGQRSPVHSSKSFLCSTEESTDLWFVPLTIKCHRNLFRFLLAPQLCTPHSVQSDSLRSWLADELMLSSMLRLWFSCLGQQWRKLNSQVAVSKHNLMLFDSNRGLATSQQKGSRQFHACSGNICGLYVRWGGVQVLVFLMSY